MNKLDACENFNRLLNDLLKEMSDLDLIKCMSLVGKKDEWFWYFKKELERRRE